MPEPVASPISPTTESLSTALDISKESGDEYSVLDDATMNHLTYKATHKVPYIIDYLGLRDMYEINPEVTQMARELHTIYVDDDSEVQVQETKVQLDALSQELNLQENDAPFYKLRKMLKFAQIKQKLKQNETMRLRMMQETEKM